MKHLIFSFLLCALSTSFVASATTSLYPVNKITLSDFSCNLPGPSNLVLNNFTTSSIDATWSPVVGAIGYQVEGYRVGDNALLYSSPETGTSHTLIPLPEGTDVRVEVRAICANNEVSGQVSVAYGSTDIAIDLIVSAFTCRPSGTGPCGGSVNAGASTAAGKKYTCNYAVNQIYRVQVMQIFNNVYFKNTFYILCNYENTNHDVDVWTSSELETNQLGILVGMNGSSDPSDNNVYLKVSSQSGSQGTEWCRITCSQVNTLTPSITLTASSANSGNSYYILNVESCGSDGGGEGEGGPRDFQPEDGYAPTVSSTPEMMVFPNPFSDNIKVLLNGFKQNEPVSVRITDVSGKTIYTEKVKYNGQVIDIEAAHLNQGVYFIQVSNEENVITRKIIRE